MPNLKESNLTKSRSFVIARDKNVQDPPTFLMLTNWSMGLNWFGMRYSLVLVRKEMGISIADASILCSTVEGDHNKAYSPGEVLNQDDRYSKVVK